MFLAPQRLRIRDTLRSLWVIQPPRTPMRYDVEDSAAGTALRARASLNLMFPLQQQPPPCRRLPVPLRIDGLLIIHSPRHRPAHGDQHQLSNQRQARRTSPPKRPERHANPGPRGPALGILGQRGHDAQGRPPPTHRSERERERKPAQHSNRQRDRTRQESCARWPSRLGPGYPSDVPRPSGLLGAQFTPALPVS
jgi:hypothetical protein